MAGQSTRWTLSEHIARRSRWTLADHIARRQGLPDGAALTIEEAVSIAIRAEPARPGRELGAEPGEENSR